MAKHLPKTFDEIDKSCQKLNLRLSVQPQSPLLLASKLQGSNKKKFKNIMKHNQQLLKLQIKKKLYSKRGQMQMCVFKTSKGLTLFTKHVTVSENESKMLLKYLRHREWFWGEGRGVKQEQPKMNIN